MKHIYGRKDSKKVYELKISNLEKSRLIKKQMDCIMLQKLNKQKNKLTISNDVQRKWGIK